MDNSNFSISIICFKMEGMGTLMDALDARAKQIEESLSKAEKVTADAEVQAEKNEQILQDARNEAQEIISASKRSWR